MTAPESWLIVEAVAERLRAIKIAGGYRTDAGLKVVTEHALIEEASEQPQLLVFLDGPMNPAASSSTKWRDLVAPLTVQGRYPIRLEDAQRRAHDLASDLQRAIPPDTTQLTTDEWNFRIESIAIIQRPFGADTVVVEMGLLVSHRVFTPTA